MSTANNDNNQNVIKRRGPDLRFVWGVVAVIILGVSLSLYSLGNSVSPNPIKPPTTLEDYKNLPGARWVYTLNYEKDGETKIVEFAFRWCPAGTFMMGSPESEWNSEFRNSAVVEGKNVRNAGSEIKSNNEQLHSEKTDGFWILETPVMVEMFQAFVIKTGYQSKGNKPMGHVNNWIEVRGWQADDKYSWETPGFYYYIREVLKDQNYKIAPDQPVTTISYYDALAFCKWLSKETGLNIDLPTEVQWEYACRAGTSSAYFFGDAIRDNSQVNCNALEGFDSKAPDGKKHIDNNDKVEKDGVAEKSLAYYYRQQPLPCRFYKPNNWGIYDVHGTVREMCKDCIVKGGGWQDIPWSCRSAWRGETDPGMRADYQGFRIIISE